MVFSYIVMLTCIWWIVFYMVLPFGNQITIEPKKGHADSAPTKPRLGAKVIITSVISVVLTFMLAKLIENNHLSDFVNKYVNWLSEK
jgi:predicted secreted protein